MHRSRVRYAVALAGVLLATSGCGGDDSPSARENDWPHGSGNLVLQMETQPGMVPPDDAAAQPDFTLYGDGTLVVPGSQPSAEMIADLDDDAVADLLGQAVALVEDGEATGNAGPDAPVVQLVFIRHGVREEATLDGTDEDVLSLRQQVLDSVADTDIE